MKHFIDCAMKRERCDLVIKGAKVFNVFTGEITEDEIAVADGKIVAIGKDYEGEIVYDGRGKIAIPGLIDAHIHVESSMLSPEEFASLAVPRGTSGIVADPHEIVNVCGVEGAEYMAHAFHGLDADGVCPIDVYLQLPSCVPATPFETSGAILDGGETEYELERDLFHGLGEMMNYPAVIAGEPDCLRKLAAAHSFGKVVDGHAPTVSGEPLNAYASAGVKTDHEALTAEECREKIGKGMYIQLRNGSSAHNIEENCKAMDSFNYRRFLLCTDDKNAYDLSTKGHLDDGLRRLVKCGIPTAQAIATATLNTAECYGLKGKGALAPSYDADIVLMDDLVDFRAAAVFKAGKLVAEEGKPLFDHESRYFSSAVRGSVRLDEVTPDSFRIRTESGHLWAMSVYPDSLMTGMEDVRLESKDGDVVLKDDILKLAVLERHFASGNIGLGLLKGYGFHGGAIGITVAHDSHNMVILGDDNAAMARIAELLRAAGGGMALVREGEEDVFPLDIAGLMSSAPAEEVIARTTEIAERARSMGIPACYEPFMTLVFLSLAVIPKARLTDRGLVDVDKFEIVDLEVGE